MSDQQWFYEKNGEQQGPVSPETIQSMASSGAIAPDCLVWREGLPQWTAFSSSELAGGSTAVTPLNPPTKFTPREARLHPDFNFSIFRVLGKSWNVMCADFWPFVGFYLLIQMIFGLASNLILPLFFMMFPIMGGYMYYTLKKVRGEPADLENLFDGFKRRFGSLAAISALVWIPIMILIVPVIGFLIYAGANEAWANANVPLVLAVTFGGFALIGLVSSVVGTLATLATLLCLDCDIGWTQSLRLATRAYTKHFFKMTLFSVLAYFLLNAGVLVFIVGMFISGAWMITAFSVVYEEAFGDRKSEV